MSILKREGEREREHLYPEDEVVLRPDDLASECGDGKRQVSDGNGLRAVVWGKDGGNGTCEEGEEDEEDEEKGEIRRMEETQYSSNVCGALPECNWHAI